MAGKVLILRWAGSSYDSLGGLSEMYAREFAGLGLDVMLFTAEGPEWPHRLLQLLAREKFTFALTMSGIATDLVTDGSLAWETAGVPLFNWNCDHPGYFPRRHGIRNRFVLHGYVFPDHARYNARHLDANGSAFAVHMGIPPRSLFGEAPLPLEQRNGRIMFAKTGRDIKPIEEGWRSFGPDLRHVLFTAAEELWTASTGAFLPVLQRLGEPRGLFLDGNNSLALLLIRELDGYVRAKRSNLVMETARQYPVDVFGGGWDHIATDGHQVRLMGPVGWHKTIEQLPHYTGCLSQNPLVEDSVHDRVFFAVAAGVPPISDDNAFMRAHMPELGPCSFDFTPARIENAIETVLAHPAAAIASTEVTWNSLKDDFGTRRSAIQIAQFALVHHLNSRCNT